jgi:hypothetical protein
MCKSSVNYPLKEEVHFFHEGIVQSVRAAALTIAASYG